MAIKVCIIGYGRMGKSIDSILSQFGCTSHCIINEVDDWNKKEFKSSEVAIDFSLPASAKNNIINCISAGIPIVSGTTGWLDDLDFVKSQLENHPQSAFLYGSNFSLGMNLFFRINQFTTKIMEIESSYSIEMTEIHHTKKLDAPSGTAITLAEDIIDMRKDKKSWINEVSKDPDVIGIKSERLPNVPGTHIINYENQIDRISIEHEAKSRLGFAQGAIMAAKWLIGRNGYFTISDYVDDLLKTQFK